MLGSPSNGQVYLSPVELQPGGAGSRAVAALIRR